MALSVKHTDETSALWLGELHEEWEEEETPECCWKFQMCRWDLMGVPSVVSELRKTSLSKDGLLGTGQSRYHLGV